MVGLLIQRSAFTIVLLGSIGTLAAHTNLAAARKTPLPDVTSNHLHGVLTRRARLRLRAGSGLRVYRTTSPILLFSSRSFSGRGQRDKGSFEGTTDVHAPRAGPLRPFRERGLPAEMENLLEPIQNNVVK